MKIVIFAGGVGTRLWPLSRKKTPKQFEKLIGDRSTLQKTIDRLLPEFSPSDIFIATGSRYEQIVKEQLPDIPAENFIFEPEMRDVGPAIGLMSAILRKRFYDEPIAILWSDHMVKNIDAFKKALFTAKEMIEEQKARFIFIAQKARFANQNMGWIKVGELMNSVDGINIFPFEKLIYRPSLEDAQQFLTESKYVWNLGYFVTTPVYLASLFESFAPDMYQKLMQIADGPAESFVERVNTIYPTLEKVSFDDVVLMKMKSDHTFVISSDLGWSDVGAWESLKEALTDSQEENVTKGKVMLEDSKDTLLFNYTNQLAVGIDLDEFLIINTGDVLLICPKHSVPKIKKLVEKMAGTEHDSLT